MRRRIQISPSRMGAVICTRNRPQAAKHLLTNKIPETLDNRCTDVIPLQHTIHESQTQLSTLKNTNNETKHFDNASVVRLPMGYGAELRHLAQLRVGTTLPQRGRNQVPNVHTCPMPKRTTTVLLFPIL